MSSICSCKSPSGIVKEDPYGIPVQPAREHSFDCTVAACAALRSQDIRQKKFVGI